MIPEIIRPREMLAWPGSGTAERTLAGSGGLGEGAWSRDEVRL